MLVTPIPAVTAFLAIASVAAAADSPPTAPVPPWDSFHGQITSATGKLTEDRDTIQIELLRTDRWRSESGENYTRRAAVSAPQTLLPGRRDVERDDDSARFPARRGRAVRAQAEGECPTARARHRPGNCSRHRLYHVRLREPASDADRRVRERHDRRAKRPRPGLHESRNGRHQAPEKAARTSDLDIRAVCST